ncbi:hypothetical protein EMN47_15915 [Prolixibacteraceae bacterium JC049]|nr:hypothetical protein [Prolixibacteraceae bacterium JC049]
MGTSQSISPGVAGDPSWGKTSSSISNLANRIDKENANPSILHNSKYQQKRTNSFKKTLSNYIKAAGGKSSMSSGSSSKGGKAAISTARSLGGVLYRSSQGEFNDYVAKSGFENIQNKSKSDLVHFLMEDLCGPTNNFDEAAAKAALNEFLEQILEGTEDAKDVEDALNESVQDQGIDNLLVDYFGFYVFEHLYEMFEERLFASKGEKLCNQTMGEIKDFVFSEIKVLNDNTKLSSIDWEQSSKHDSIVKNIFSNVIEIFE